MVLVSKLLQLLVSVLHLPLEVPKRLEQLIDLYFGFKATSEHKISIAVDSKYERTRFGCFYVTAILSWGWGWVDVDIETEADLRLGLMLGWDDVETKFSWNLVEVGVGKGFKNCSGVYSCSWTTFIFYVSFNSDIWFWPNFGVIFYFLGP